MKLLFSFFLTLLSYSTFAEAGCPLTDKCPYVSNHHVPKGSPCPLEKAGCPYFEKHKNDESLKEFFSHDKGCPMEKCPYFEVSFNFEFCILLLTK